MRFKAFLSTFFLCFSWFLPSSFAQDQIDQLLATDGDTGDEYGTTVSIDGDYALVGAPFDDDNGDASGAAYIYYNDGTGWVEQIKLIPADVEPEARFGRAVSIDGDYAVIGTAPLDISGAKMGAVYIFVRDGSTWIQQAKLEATDGSFAIRFGTSVDLDGANLIIGSHQDRDQGSQAGAAYIFSRNGSTWAEQVKLLPSDVTTDDRYGFDVAVDGDQALVGSYRDDPSGFNSGSVYAYEWDGVNWNQTQKFTASDGAAEDWFGRELDLSGSTALIAAMGDDDFGDRAGAAYIFEQINGVWTEQQKLYANDADVLDRFAGDVRLEGGSAIIGAFLDDDGGVDAGSAYVFSNEGNTWVQAAKLIASDALAGDFLGFRVDLDNDQFIAGAFGKDVVGNTDVGAVYVFSDSGPLSDAVVWAENSVWLKQGSDVISGHVITNSSSPGPVLAANSELTVGVNSTTASGYQLFGEDLKVKQGAIIDSDVFSNRITGSGTVNGFVDSLASLPVIANMPDFKHGIPGGADITVEKNDSLMLPAGNYNNVLVKANSKLTLFGGTYSFNNIDVRQGAELLFDAASEVLVADKFNSNSASTIGPSENASIDASSLVFYIEGENGTTGDLSDNPKAAKIGVNSDVDANFYVPNGTLWIKQGSAARGAFLAKDVIMGVDVQVSLDSYLGGSGAAMSTQLAIRKLEKPSVAEIEKPSGYTLDANYPNPFNPQTMIGFSLIESGEVKLAVYDMLGREVGLLIDGYRNAGAHQVIFEAGDLPSGMYVYRLETPGGNFSRTMQLVK